MTMKRTTALPCFGSSHNQALMREVAVFKSDPPK